MLNELYRLAMVLENVGIKPYEWHKDLKPLPNASYKKPCYRICIDSDGFIAAINPINLETVTFLRKWERNNGDSFPGFNIQPLYRITDDENKKLLKKWWEGKEAVDVGVLKKWCSLTETRNWDRRMARRINKCLGIIPQELYELSKRMTADFDAVRELCKRVVPLGQGDSSSFFQILESFIWRSLEIQENVRSLLPVLIHEGASAKKPEEDRGSISVFMDIPDWTEYPVAHEKSIKCINKHLLRQTTGNVGESGNSDTDAFGQGAHGVNEKLPEVKLPVLGGVKLRAMFREIPCQYRYGTIDAESYPVGADSRKLAKCALEWLKDGSREGQTWGRVDGREVLFAYLSAEIKQPVKLASCFGARKQDDTEARFARYAQDVVDCLKGFSPTLDDVELRVFSLRKMDKARTKVVFNRNFSARKLADAAKEWQEGCANIPDVPMKRYNEDGKTTLTGPETPFPLQVPDCLNQVWRMDGARGDKVNVIPKSSGIELLLEESADTLLVPHLLSVGLQNGKALFLSLGHALHRNRNDARNLSGLDKHKQLMPAILGLLLWKLGIRKEIYMVNSPYLIGRMLKLADELHALYCKEVRAGRLPPQLLGNALMVAALDSPTQALAQLALRIAPYLAWARTNSTASAGRSRYFLKEIGIVGGKLRDLTMPARFKDAERAQLLLGYVSSNAQAEDSVISQEQKGENHGE